MGRGSRWGRLRSNRKGTFDPTDSSRVTHTRMGVWDLYEEMNPGFEHIPGSSWLEKSLEVYACLPYLLRIIKDILSIRSCWFLLTSYAIAETLQALLPAVTLW